MQAELLREASRLDCSISLLMQRAWRIARHRFAEQRATDQRGGLAASVKLSLSLLLSPSPSTVTSALPLA